MARTSSEATADILGHMPTNYDRSKGSVIYDLQAPVGEEIAGLEATNDEILANAFFDTASDEYKEVIAKDRANITRRAATFATGYVTITGEAGTEISEGTQVASDFLVFATMTDARIGEEGSATVPVRCETAGSAGNVPSGAIYEFPVTISGLNTVTNSETFTNGYDIESIADFSDRYHSAITRTSGAGTEEDYENWALEVTGVSAARCFGRTPSVGSVTVFIMNQNHRAASAELIEETEDHIDELRPTPANVYVYSVSEVSIDVSATVYVASGSVADYEQAITAAINDYIYSIGYSRDTRRVSNVLIGEAILQVEGVTDVEDLLVNEGTSSISLSDSQIAVLREVTINGQE